MKKADKNMLMYLAIGLLIGGGIIYYYNMPNTLGQIPIPPPGNMPLPTQQLSCSDYNFRNEFYNYFGATNMQLVSNACNNANGTWKEQPNEVSCYISYPILDCNNNNLQYINTLCTAMKGTYTCTPFYVGCTCNVAPPSVPKPLPSGNQPDQGYTCAWQTNTYGGQCGGTCPTGKICQRTGGFNCACETPGGSENPGQGQIGNIFVTSTKWNGAMGHIAGADAKCSNVAQYAGFSGTWIALISSNVSNIKDRLPDRAYYRLDGTLIANSKADLFDGNIANPINLDEHYTNTAAIVWTGSSQDGSGTWSDCHEWGWVSATGTFGSTTQTNSFWINGGAQDCSQGNSLYCVRVA